MGVGILTEFCSVYFSMRVYILTEFSLCIFFLLMRVCILTEFSLTNMFLLRTACRLFIWCPPRVTIQLNVSVSPCSESSMNYSSVTSLSAPRSWPSHSGTVVPFTQPKFYRNQSKNLFVNCLLSWTPGPALRLRWNYVLSRTPRSTALLSIFHSWLWSPAIHS